MGYIYPQTRENGLHDSKVISTNLSNILFIKGIGEIGRSIPKGWSTYKVANASQTTCLPGRKVNRKCALHQLVGRIEKALDAREYALGIFFDIEGAFDNTPTTVVATALEDWKIHRSVKNWITTLTGRKQVCVKTEHILITATTSRGLPQGGGLSPTLWSAVVDNLLKRLSKQGVFVQGYADDGVDHHR